jgi:hypothetical protein
MSRLMAVASKSTAMFLLAQKHVDYSRLVSFAEEMQRIIKHGIKRK